MIPPRRSGDVIETPRLVLRPHAVSDLRDCLSMWRDPAVVRFIGNGQAHSEEAVWARLLRYAGCWRLLGFGYWAVRERGTGRFVGDVGFQSLHRTTDPPLPDLPEAGWVLAASAQGRGFAREAIAAVLAWADAHLTAPATVCIIRPDHGRSVRIAEEAGYRSTGAARLAGEPMAVFSRPRAFPSKGPAPTS
jgi:RimJ/RimL family protein N-acetyltransferase